MGMRWGRAGALAALLAMAGHGAAQAATDRLSSLDAEMAGARTQVLVLGSVHLNQGTPKDFDPDSLEPLLRRLAAFAPQVVTIEAMPGETCDLMRRHPTIYSGDDVKTYCPDPAAAQAATGLDVPAAIAAVRDALAAWPAVPTPAQRRQLASRFLAAGDPTSALVQWLQLPADEQRAGDGLDDALVASLRRREASNNENNRIGARLAARLGLQRVHAVDDHTGDNVDVGDHEAYGKAIMAAWTKAAPQAQPVRDREAALFAGGDMLALYRYTNSPAYLDTALRADFGAALADPSPQQYGQRYVAGWEGRNLRMVANLRVAFADRPGARVLAIVGASHKPWFDDLLGRLQGVDVVDAEAFLAGE